MNYETMIEHVKQAIDPKFQDWVLFENGTYIIFDNADTLASIDTEAKRIMRELGPVHAGTASGDFEVSPLIATEGWVVSSHAQGMYTYVHPKELEQTDPVDLFIGLFGRSKRALDGNTARIIHINRKTS